MAVIDVYGLPPVSNVCDQTLREVIALPDFSLAHVIMDPLRVSLLHKHDRMSEIYYVLNGEGILFCGTDAIRVMPGSCAFIPSSTPHKLWNSGESKLEHLVIAAPPFDPSDVIVLDAASNADEYFFDSRGVSFAHQPIVAQDGAVVRELLSRESRDVSRVGLAVGSLSPKREAALHKHLMSDEVYYVVSGEGRVSLGDAVHDVKADSVVYIPRGAVHGLQNLGGKALEILCISSPPYSDDDFIRI
jgi:mannose-6-phosphate isomerase-like protein (cupin superfamily)